MPRTGTRSARRVSLRQSSNLACVPVSGRSRCFRESNLKVLDGAGHSQSPGFGAVRAVGSGVGKPGPDSRPVFQPIGMRPFGSR